MVGPFIRLVRGGTMTGRGYGQHGRPEFFVFALNLAAAAGD
jgi:hypothetical protein